MSKFGLFSVAWLILTSAAASATRADTLPLDAFAMLPAIQQVSVSPDGKKLGILRATSKEGDYIIEVFATDNLAAKPVRLGADRMEITAFNWLRNDRLGVSFRQNIQDGNSNYWVSQYAFVNADGKGEWLIPFRGDNGANFSVLSTLTANDKEILLSYDINNNGIDDAILYNIDNGKTKTVFRGNTKFNGDLIADRQGNIRAVTGYDLSSNTIKIYARQSLQDDWRTVYSISPANRTNWEPLQLSVDNPAEIYIAANMGENTAGIYRYNFVNDTYSERLFGLDAVDIDGGVFSNKKASLGELIGYRYTTKNLKYHFLDDDNAALYDGVQGIFPRQQVSLSSRSEDDQMIVVYTQADNNPGTYYLLQNQQKLEKIGERFPALQPEHLAKVKYISFTASDGLKIPAYVTIPKGKKPFPTVVMPHGGPWARDRSQYDEWSQLLAHHGYMVVQPQFRGSTGYGMRHWLAGDSQWGLKMQDDMDESALFLVKKGLADPKRLAMFGWSYGGYSAFVGSMRDNNIYQCTIAGAGVSNLDRINATLNDSRYLKILQKPTIKGVSPVDQVEKVNVPILIIHGDIDQRVPIKHSDEFVEQLQALKKDHKYLVLEGADHFYDTLYYRHKTSMYTEMLDWLKTKCG